MRIETLNNGGRVLAGQTSTVEFDLTFDAQADGHPLRLFTEDGHEVGRGHIIMRTPEPAPVAAIGGCLRCGREMGDLDRCPHCHYRRCATCGD